MAMPAKVDLRQWCSPIENQLQIGLCTAQAAVGVVEYFENRAFGKHLDGSRLFVYKTTRNSWGVGWGDKGYGWLPYEYVLNKLAVDFWSLLQMGWVDTKHFGL